MHKLNQVLVIAIHLLSAVACGTLEVGIEQTTAQGEPFTPGPEPSETPTVWLTPTPHMDTWDTYSNPIFGISLEYPTTWQPVTGYSTPETGEVRYAGVNGFFHISAMGAETLDDAAAQEAGHVLQPYGSRPIIENLQVKDQDARLILPSVDQPAGMDRQAALIVHYPQPISIGGYTYPYFVLWADMEHIRTIAQTLEFSVNPSPVETPTPLQPLTWQTLPPGLVYTTFDGLWLIDAAEQPVQIHNSPQASISPDSTRLLSYDNLQQDIWLIDLDSGGVSALTRTPDRRECCFRWWPAMPDMVLFSSVDDGAEVEPGAMGYLSTINVTGDEYQILDGEHDTGPGQLAPSPDGQTIAYGGGTTGWLYRWATGPEPFDPAEYGLTGYGEAQIAQPSWSSDGRTLAWIVKDNIAAGSGYRAAVGLFDLESRSARVLHPYEAQGVGWPAAPVWNPDSQWLAFGDSSPTENAGLWVARADGQQERHLGLGGNPVWSPDGRWLAFQSTSEEGPPVYILADVTTWQLYPLNLPVDRYGSLVDWIYP